MCEESTRTTTTYKLTRSALLIWLLLIISGYSALASDTLLLRYENLTYPVRQVISDDKGTIWICSGRGLERLADNGQFQLVDPGFYGLVANTNGKIELLRNLPDSASSNFNQDFGGWHNKVPAFNNSLSVAKSSNNEIWVCNGKDLFVFKIIKPLQILLKGLFVRGIAIVNGHLYANAGGKVYKDNQQIFQFSELLADGSVFSREDTVYSCDGGLLFRDSSGKEERLLDYSVSISGDSMTSRGIHNFIRCGGFWGDSLWVGTAGGLAFLGADSALHRIGPEMEIKHATRADSSFGVMNSLGELWIKTGQDLQKWNLPQGVEVVDFLYLNQRKSYLLVTNQGLFFSSRLFGPIESSITLKDGLTTSLLCCALQESRDILWVSSYFGIHRINLKNREIQVFSQKTEFNRYSKAQDDNGHLYFGALDGVYKIMPERLPQILNANQQLSLNKKVQLVILGLCALLFIAIGYIVFNRRLTISAIKEKDEELKQQGELLRQNEIKLFQLNAENIILADLELMNTRLLADKMGLSHRTMHRTFKKYGFNPGEMIRSLRLRKVTELLETHSDRLAHISMIVGYSEKYIKQIIKAREGEDITEDEL